MGARGGQATLPAVRGVVLVGLPAVRSDQVGHHDARRSRTSPVLGLGHQPPWREGRRCERAAPAHRREGGLIVRFVKFLEICDREMYFDENCDCEMYFPEICDSDMYFPEIFDGVIVRIIL